jgi:phosphomannomutase/phosphoglucomutase
LDIDGVRFEEGDAWGLVRPSNTQPVIVLRFEASHKEKLDTLAQDTRHKLKEIMERMMEGRGVPRPSTPRGDRA